MFGYQWLFWMFIWAGVPALVWCVWWVVDAALRSAPKREAKMFGEWGSMLVFWVVSGLVPAWALSRVSERLLLGSRMMGDSDFAELSAMWVGLLGVFFTTTVGVRVGRSNAPRAGGMYGWRIMLALAVCVVMLLLPEILLIRVVDQWLVLRGDIGNFSSGAESRMIGFKAESWMMVMYFVPALACSFAASVFAGALLRSRILVVALSWGFGFLVMWWALNVGGQMWYGLGPEIEYGDPSAWRTFLGLAIGAGMAMLAAGWWVKRLGVRPISFIEIGRKWLRPAVAS